MANSLQDVVNAAYRVNEATKPVAQASSMTAAELGKATQQLAAAVSGNRNSGPAAVHALDLAIKSLQEVHVSIDRMNRSITAFVDEQMSK
ncbi:MAG: hypothetical protein LBG81_05140 [Coriobacteriaceae bacterium]|jgi:hypothetical protein|nr:hypothetical protein [Coriobacteriaceae bacterium]